MSIARPPSAISALQPATGALGLSALAPAAAAAGLGIARDQLALSGLPRDVVAALSVGASMGFSFGLAMCEQTSRHAHFETRSIVSKWVAWVLQSESMLRNF